MRGNAFLRDLRQLQMLPLRCETVYHLVFDPHGTEQPSLNRLIAVDPALALALLRLAPRSLREGRASIAQIARCTTPIDLYELVRQSGNHSYGAGSSSSAMLEQIWTHSIATAHAARQLSRRHQYAHPQTAFLAGLLHHLGLMAAAIVAPEQLSRSLDETQKGSEWASAEEHYLGITHTNLANKLARRWGLPQWLHDVLWWHHQSDESLPASLSDRALVQLVRDAESIVSENGFALGGMMDAESWELPWKSNDALAASVVRGVRQAATFVQNHPLRDAAEQPAKFVAHAVELAMQNASLHADVDWRSKAWDRYRAIPVDAALGELTGVVAETFAQALGALGAACYVRSSDGSSAEGTFWCDGSRRLGCSLAQGRDSKPHEEQVVAHLRPTWQQRSFRRINLDDREESLAHVLIWLDQFGPAASDSMIDEVTQLCTSWVARAVYIADLETQLESCTAALRQQAAEAAARLEDAKLAALAEMAAGAGHEVNNPLAVISGRAQLLLAEETDPRRRKSLETIIAQAQRIHRIIVDLMTFARPSAPDCKPIDILQPIDRAVGLLKEQADARRINLTVHVSANVPQVSGDVAQLAAAFECILRNSLEATVEAGAVQVIVEPGPDATVSVRICDTGPGISEEQRQHIFEPFYSGREAGRGLGLGLPKAWRLIQNHGGEIMVGSSAQGTTVTVQLPALASAADRGRACA